MTHLHEFRALDREWASITTQPAARRAARRWAQTQPLLARYRCPAAVLDTTRHASPASANEILAALLELGDDLAVRTVLQALLPLADRHLIRARGRGLVGPGQAWANTAELAAELTAELWVWLHARAGRPQSWPASRADKALDQYVRRTVDKHRARTNPTTVLDPERHSPASRSDALDRCAHLLLDAHHDGTIDTLTAQMLYGLAVRGDTIADVAGRAGVTAAALQQRRLRYQHSRRAAALHAEWAA